MDAFDYTNHLRQPGALQEAQKHGYGLADAASDAVNWLGKRPGVPESPYQTQWDALLAQLQATANGTGRSLAGDAFKKASQQGMNNLLSVSRGGSAGAARQGAQAYGQLAQGQAFGYSNARIQEQLAAQQALQSALTGAGNQWMQRMQLQMAQPTNLQTLTGIAGQGLAAYGMIAGGGAPAAAMAGGMQPQTGPAMSPSGNPFGQYARPTPA